MKLIRVAWIAAQLRLDIFNGACVQEIAQLLLTEQFAQKIAVERQRLGSPLRGRRVVLVHVRGDVVEEERGGIWGCRSRFDVDEIELACPQSVQEALQGRQVEDVL